MAAAARRLSSVLSRSLSSSSSSSLLSLRGGSSWGRSLSRYSTAAVVENPVIPPVDVKYNKKKDTS